MHGWIARHNKSRYRLLCSNAPRRGASRHCCHRVPGIGKNLQLELLSLFENIRGIIQPLRICGHRLLVPFTKLLHHLGVQIECMFHSLLKEIRIRTRASHQGVPRLPHGFPGLPHGACLPSDFL